MKIKQILLTVFFISVLVNYINADTIEVGFTDWKPYTYQENGVYKGSVIEIAKAVFKRAGIKANFKIAPWARVYKKGQTDKNYMIAGLARTPKREKHFNWVGSVTKKVKLYFYKLKSNPIKVRNLADVKKYRVAVEKNAYTHEFLMLKNFDNSKIHPVIKSKQLFKLVHTGRDEFILIEENRVKKEARDINLSPDLFEKTIFAFESSVYLAFSKNSDFALVEKLKKAYQELEKEGKIKLY